MATEGVPPGQKPLSFTASGMLPPGDHEMTLAELRNSLLVRGPVTPGPWDSEWRMHLVDGLEVLASHLWQVGVDEVYVDGSFASDKPRPGDIDGYFVCDRSQWGSGQLEEQLQELSAVWTWETSSRTYGEGKLQLPMWHQYRVELFPHYGQSSGITNEHGNELDFPAAFRLARETHEPRGIVKLRRER